MKLPARTAPLLFAGLLSALMVTLITGVALLQREGLHPTLAAHWAQAFWGTWPVAFPVAAVVGPLVRRFVGAVTHAPA